jgi:hypothetical protein
MTTIHERSAGVIPYQVDGNQEPLFLVLHSATVRNPRAKWEFPKGGMETGESTRDTAAREFQEETGLVEWSFREGFEKSLSYTYIRRGRKVVKTVTYSLAEVRNAAALPAPPSTSTTRTVTGTIGGRSMRSPACSITPRSGKSSPKRTRGSRDDEGPRTKNQEPGIEEGSASPGMLWPGLLTGPRGPTGGFPIGLEAVRWSGSLVVSSRLGYGNDDECPPSFHSSAWPLHQPRRP